MSSTSDYDGSSAGREAPPAGQENTTLSKITVQKGMVVDEPETDTVPETETSVRFQTSHLEDSLAMLDNRRCRGSGIICRRRIRGRARRARLRCRPRR